MKAAGEGDRDLAERIEEITVDAYGEGEQLKAFRQAFEDELSLPAEAFVIGESRSRWWRLTTTATRAAV